MNEDRLVLKYTFERAGRVLANKLKIVNNVDFFQIYVINGSQYGQFRMSKEQAKEFKMFLEKELDEC